MRKSLQRTRRWARHGCLARVDLPARRAPSAAALHCALAIVNLRGLAEALDDFVLSSFCRVTFYDVRMLEPSSSTFVASGSLETVVVGTLSGRVLLVVEDEQLIALHLAEILESAGALVVVATSLPAAIAAVDGNTNIEAAVVDRWLGVADSAALCDRLRSRGIPFAIHTAYTKPSDRVWGEALYLQKPTRPELLVAAVEALLEK